ncbi:MAG TPA: PEP-CTERM sorting domain-containing protein, partial [Bryobacteraceae bacterium]|nr:PEP-CTERM sorting domain-containing protein [Bryobacteraceae bacterium]
GLCASLPLAQASVLTFGFQCITNNVSSQCLIGQNQLFVDVVDDSQSSSFGGVTVTPSSGQVGFLFYNTGPSPSVITLVLFDDGVLSLPLTLVQVSGVSFSQVSGSPQLPGGGNLSPPFATTAGFGADANPPPPGNGVGPGEALGIIFSLASGSTWSDVINAMGTGSLRIGLHVQSIGTTGGSEGFINTPNPIPEPATLGLVGAGLLLLGWRRRKTS